MRGALKERILSSFLVQLSIQHRNYLLWWLFGMGMRKEIMQPNGVTPRKS